METKTSDQLADEQWVKLLWALVMGPGVDPFGPFPLGPVVSYLSEPELLWDRAAPALESEMTSTEAASPGGDHWLVRFCENPAFPAERVTWDTIRDPSRRAAVQDALARSVRMDTTLVRSWLEDSRDLQGLRSSLVLSGRCSLEEWECWHRAAGPRSVAAAPLTRAHFRDHAYLSEHGIIGNPWRWANRNHPQPAGLSDAEMLNEDELAAYCSREDLPPGRAVALVDHGDRLWSEIVLTCRQLSFTDIASVNTEVWPLRVRPQGWTALEPALLATVIHLIDERPAWMWSELMELAGAIVR